MRTLTIDNSDFIKGCSITDELANAGYSPSQKGHNLFLSKGEKIYPQPKETEVTGLLDDLVGGVEDNQVLGKDAYFVDESGNFYQLNGTTLTKKQTATGSYNFNWGNSDIVLFGTDVFCTASTDIIKLGAGLASIDDTWWTGTEGKSSLGSFYRHPMEVIEGVLYIGDGESIHVWDGTTAQEDWMTLPDSFMISNLLIHPDGRHLMAFASNPGVNFSHSKKARGKIYIIDTVTAEFIQEIDVSDQTEGAINNNGITFVTYGKIFGYFTGGGYKHLRSLDSSISTGDQLAYSQGIKNKGNVVMIKERDGILAYGDINGMGNIFFYPYYNINAKNDIKFFMPLGSGKMMVNYYDDGTSSHKFVVLDYEDDDDEAFEKNIKFRTNRHSFGGKVWVRKVVIYTEKFVDGAVMTAKIKNNEGTEIDLNNMEYSVDGAIKEKRTDLNFLTDNFQIEVRWHPGATTAVPLKKIAIHYESGE